MAEGGNRLEYIKIAIAVVGLTGAIIGAIQYFRHDAIQTRDDMRKSELQVLQLLYGEELSICKSIADAIAALTSATDQGSFDKAFATFADLKHGRALLLADKDTLDAMITVYNSAYRIRSSDKKGRDFQQQVIENICNGQFEVILSCRKRIVDEFGKFGGNIKAIDPKYTMNWSPNACKNNSSE